MLSDVPVGAFLSSGIDSGALVGLMRDAGQTSIQTVTLSFEEFRGSHHDEAPLAAQVAALYGTTHTNRVVTQSEFNADLPRILDAMDQPSIDGVNTWFVSKAARELGLKVVVSGLGGDELLGGYPSFSTIPGWVKWLSAPSRIPAAGGLVRRAANALPALGLMPKAASLVEYGGSYAGAYFLRRGLFMPWELTQVLPADVVRDGLRRLDLLGLIGSHISPPPRTPFAKIATLESSLYMRNQLLRDSDWASMAHGLELRVPLVDSQLLSDIAPHTVRSAPQTLKQMLANSPSIPLLDAVKNRSKTGFTTPVADWLKDTGSQSRAYSKVPSLAGPRCHWSRRWAYSVAAA
jgi:asparagine synthase (glutamine-hydrolysing)